MKAKALKDNITVCRVLSTSGAEGDLRTGRVTRPVLDEAQGSAAPVSRQLRAESHRGGRGLLRYTTGVQKGVKDSCWMALSRSSDFFLQVNLEAKRLQKIKKTFPITEYGLQCSNLE
ncbi:unnamed protein product [Boreogadus saida]